MSANGVKTYRGRGLDELLPKIRAELGEDAVILAQREDAEGGVGGFFARRMIEVDARAAARIDVQADEPALPDEPELWAGPPPTVEPDSSVAMTPEESGSPVEREMAAAAESFEEHLRSLLRAPAPAPAHRPSVAPQLPEVPEPEPEARAVETAEWAPPAPVEEPEIADAPADESATEPAAAEAVVEEPGPVVAEPEPAPTFAAEPETDPEPVAFTEPEPVLPGEPEPATVVEPAPAPDESFAVEAAAPAPPVEPEIVPAPVTAAAPSRPAHTQRDHDPEAVALREALVDVGVGTQLAEALVDETVTHLAPLAKDPSLVPLVRRALAARIPTHAVRGAGGRVVGFVGPGGSGKTRCVARLATAYARRSPLPVACVSLRPHDGGAELRELLSPVGVAIHAEQDAAEAARKVAELREEAIVLIDTPGVSPRADAELRVLAAELAQLQADEIHLVMPATIGPRAARELLEGTRGLAPDAIAMTHADETDALGTVVDLAIETRTPLSFVARGRSVEAGMRSADPSEIAEGLIA